MTPAVSVALIDDDLSVRRAFRRLLRYCGYAVADYPSVSAFLKDAATGMLDCVLVDVRMPGATGLALAEHLRDRGVGVPIILMTGDADASLDQKAAHLGVSALLRKPVNDAAILAAIEQATAARPMRKS